MKKSEKTAPDKGKLLLRSYFMSLLSLMLCVTMLLGTTYAWFTSEVETPANQIYVGSLKIALKDGDGNDLTKEEYGSKLFGSATFRWEPGATQMETIKIYNEGELSFDYNLYFCDVNPESVNPNHLKSISKYIEVYVTTDSKVVEATENAQQMKETWVRVGTLHDALYKSVKLAGGEYIAAKPDEVGQLVGSTTIALHMPGTVTEKDIEMKTTAGGLSLRLVATQKVSEEDAFGKDYDQSAPMDLEVDTYEEFREAVEGGESVALTADITIPADEKITIAKGQNVTIDTNGHTISSVSKVSTSNRELFKVQGSLSMNGGGKVTYKHDGENMNWDFMSTILTISGGGAVHLDGVTLVNEGGTDMNYVAHLYNDGTASLYMNNAKLKANYIAVRLFNNCYDMNNVVATNSTLEGKYSLWVHHYTGDLDSTKHSDEAIKARLNINIYNGNNVLVGPVLYGYNNTEYHVANVADFKAAVEKGVSKIVLTNDLDFGAATFTIKDDLTLDLNGHNLTGAYTGADHYAMFTIPSSASLTVNGEGVVKADTVSEEGNRSLAIFQNDGDLTINGGTYTVSNVRNDKTWVIATIVDNRTKSATSAAKLTINAGDFSVTGDAINLFRNYPQQGGSATLIINGGAFHSNGNKETYIWNQESGTNIGKIYFNGGTYDDGVVYEDYNGQDDIHIGENVVIKPYSGNN